MDQIIIRGAREHNLKNVNLTIPRNKLVVFTGLSGSGKSSLAYDTLYAEGQRRYVESLSAYARQFLGRMEKPNVDQIEGLSPAISIDQKGASHNPRSTVGTVTEIYDYLRLLFARVGIPHCPECGRVISQQSAQQIVDAVQALPDRTRIQILAPLVLSRKGTHLKVFEDIRKEGYVRVRVDGVVRDVNEQIELDRYKIHTIEAVVVALLLAFGIRAFVVQAFKIPSGSMLETLQTGDHLLVVESGRIKVSRRHENGSDVDLAELGRGALLGEMALIDAAPRSAGAVAVGLVTAHKLSRTDFMKLVIAKSPSALKILRRIGMTTTGRLRCAFASQPQKV